jgi:hypothetical protein
VSPHVEGSASATKADPSEAATPRSLFDIEDTATRRPDGRRKRYQADDAGPLCRILNTACAYTGLRIDDLTILSTPRDPYRLDTPTNHKVGAWLAAQVAEVVSTAPIHCRGLHYKLLNRTKPNSRPYIADSTLSFTELTRRLRQLKQYRPNDGDDA